MRCSRNWRNASCRFWSWFFSLSSDGRPAVVLGLFQSTMKSELFVGRLQRAVIGRVDRTDEEGGPGIFIAVVNGEVDDKASAMVCSTTQFHCQQCHKKNGRRNVHASHMLLERALQTFRLLGATSTSEDLQCASVKLLSSEKGSIDDTVSIFISHYVNRIEWMSSHNKSKQSVYLWTELLRPLQATVA